MNTHAPEMLQRHYTAMKTTLTSGNDVSVFERQAARMKWQQQQHQQQSFFNGNDDQFPGLIEIKPDPGVQNGWPDFSDGCQDQLLPPLMADQKAKKRKTHEDHKLKVVSNENWVKDKKTKGCSAEENSKSIREKSKVTDAKKQDYIHVRARRGQATDSHSLAERVRREKISERMKYLQELVPGCNKITGKAGMLDEIINYVQSLQKQVEFLSMRLATLHPRFDSDTNNLIMKEMFEVSAVGYSSEMANYSTYLQLNSLLEMENNPLDMMLRRSIGGPLSVPETFIVSCFNQMQPSVTWDGDQQESSGIPYQLQKYTDSGEGSNLEVEM